MSRLVIYADSDPRRALETLDSPARIASALQEIGVRFRRVLPDTTLPRGAEDDHVLAAYGSAVAEERDAYGYQKADVVRMRPGAPNAAEARRKFLAEHTHTEDEARIIVEGSGSFYLHVGGRVYQVVCTAGDLISVPEGTRHWFDMGPRPSFTAIRFFIRPDGWVGHFTGDDIASRCPAHEP